MKQNKLRDQGVSKKDIIAFAKLGKKNRKRTVKKVTISQ